MARKFVQIEFELGEEFDLSLGALALFCIIASFSLADKDCFMTREQFSKALNVSVRSISMNLRILEGKDEKKPRKPLIKSVGKIKSNNGYIEKYRLTDEAQKQYKEFLERKNYDFVEDILPQKIKKFFYDGGLCNMNIPSCMSKQDCMSNVYHIIVNYFDIYEMLTGEKHPTMNDDTLEQCILNLENALEKYEFCFFENAIIKFFEQKIKDINCDMHFPLFCNKTILLTKLAEVTGGGYKEFEQINNFSRKNCNLN